MREKVNQFKEGDEVELISLTNTDNDHGVVEAMLNVGDRAFVDECDGDTVFLKDDCFSYHIKDFKLIKSVDEINTSSNEPIKKTLYSPLTVQQAGDHYKKKGIQPIEYGLANNLSFPQVNVVKYITRHEDKNGLDDLAKSIHYHFFEALRVYGEEGTHELRNKVLSLLGIEQGVFK